MQAKCFSQLLGTVEEARAQENHSVCLSRGAGSMVLEAQAQRVPHSFSADVVTRPLNT